MGKESFLSLHPSLVRELAHRVVVNSLPQKAGIAQDLTGVDSCVAEAQYRLYTITFASILSRTASLQSKPDSSQVFRRKART